MSQWIVLRTASVSTLRLAQSLRESGIEAWAPSEEVRKVVRGKAEWVETPMLPTFVFAPAERLGELIELARNPALCYQVWDNEKRRMVTRGHPFFHLFRCGENYPTIPDHELAPLHAIEGRRKRKARGKAPLFKSGDKVRLTQGAYEGLKGSVIQVKGKAVRVVFAGAKFEFDVSAHVLIHDLDNGQDCNLHPSQYRKAA